MKTHAKMKELSPIEGGGAGGEVALGERALGVPPGSKIFICQND